MAEAPIYYATKAGMISRFGEAEVIALTDREGLGLINDAVLDSARANANAEIDPYLAARYALPLSNVPIVIEGFADDITRYRLSGADVTETDIVYRRYKDAIKFFENVASGKLSLGLDAVGHAPVEQGSVQVVGGERTFTKDTLADY
jgi:phage gp36-like protein